MEVTEQNPAYVAMAKKRALLDVWMVMILPLWDSSIAKTLKVMEATCGFPGLEEDYF